MIEFKMRRPDDFHVHFRDGEMMRAVVPATAAHFGRALVMPNVPVIETGEQACHYRDSIREAVDTSLGWPEDHPYHPRPFEPLMTIKLTHRTTSEVIDDAASEDYIKAAKLYPQGVTTASHDGIIDVKVLAPVLARMQHHGMVLCVHGEEPSAFVMDREAAYLDKVVWIVKNFPGLKVVLEHITTRKAVDFVAEASVNVGATITAHHLMTTLDDVIGSGIRPHLFCYPVPKTPDDLMALRRTVWSQECDRFFFGSDSAPHPKGAKESACGCAGVFSSPVALSVLADWFVAASIPYLRRPDPPAPRELAEASRKMEAFTSINGAKFYGLPPNEGSITLRREPWAVPEMIGDVVPYRAGETLAWRVVEPRERMIAEGP